MENPKLLRPNLKPFSLPKDPLALDEGLELTLYTAMYANRKNQRLIKELSADIDAEVEKIISDYLSD